MIKMAATLALCVGSTGAFADGHVLSNARLSFTFGSSSTGYTTTDADRVDAISWVNSAGATVSNYIAQGGTACGDAVEYFGEAYGDGSDSRPYAVIGGVASNWTGTGSTKGKTAIKSLTTCSYTIDMATKSSYTLSTSPGMINALKVTRKFTFSDAPSGGDFRAYVARVSLAHYPYVIYPNTSNVLITVNADSCSFNCLTTDWNGTWMEEDDGNGNGVAIFRKPNPNYPAQITVDNDSTSASNASAITLIEPAAGWSGSLTETEYVCFHDATSWPAAQRAAGKAPAGCKGVPH